MALRFREVKTNLRKAYISIIHKQKTKLHNYSKQQDLREEGLPSMKIIR